MAHAKELCVWWQLGVRKQEVSGLLDLQVSGGDLAKGYVLDSHDHTKRDVWHADKYGWMQM